MGIKPLIFVLVKLRVGKLKKIKHIVTNNLMATLYQSFTILLHFFEELKVKEKMC